MSCPIFESKIDYVVTSPFGPRYHPVTGKYSFHTGVDIVPADGSSDTRLVALESGVIVDIDRSVKGFDLEKTKGNYIKVKTRYGRSYMYLHLAYGSIPSNIKMNATVEKDQFVGIMGSTGSSTGQHVHFQVYDIDDQILEPTQFLLGTDINEGEERMNIQIKPCKYLDRGDTVKDVQWRLSQIKEYEEEVKEHSWTSTFGFDGVYGKGLVSTVKKVEYDLGLEPTGNVTEELCDILNNDYQSLIKYREIETIVN